MSYEIIEKLGTDLDFIEYNRALKIFRVRAWKDTKVYVGTGNSVLEALKELASIMNIQ